MSTLNAMVVSCSHGPMALYRSSYCSRLMVWSWCVYKGVDSINPTVSSIQKIVAPVLLDSSPEDPSSSAAYRDIPDDMIHR